MSNEQRKAHLRSMVDAIINDDRADSQDQADLDFHAASTLIVKDILGIEVDHVADVPDDTDLDLKFDASDASDVDDVDDAGPVDDD